MIKMFQSKKYFYILFFIYYSYYEIKLIEYNKICYKIPKISVFLPIFNKEKYLKRSIGSIQKQTLKDIEIIPVNDGSTDKTIEILRELANNDQRIKIINNNKTHGSLYSRAMGILNSKGEFLMCLDPDDEYSGPNNFKYLYNRVKSLNVDFITFIILYLPERLKSQTYSNFNKIIKQPYLFNSAFINGTLIDFFITNKLVKRELFENAYKLYQKYIYGEKWNYYEDNIWSILIYKYASSSIFINKKLYYYYKNNKDSVMNNRGNILEFKNIIFRNEMLRKIFNNLDEIKYIYEGHIQLLNFLEINIEKIKNNSKIRDMFINEIIEVKKYNLSMEILNRTDYFFKMLSKKM